MQTLSDFPHDFTTLWSRYVVARDFAVRFERVALMAAIAGGPALAKLSLRRARRRSSSISKTAAPFSAAEYQRLPSIKGCDREAYDREAYDREACVHEACVHEACDLGAYDRDGLRTA